MIELPHTDKTSAKAIENAFKYAVKLRNEFLTPEHLFYGICIQTKFKDATGTDFSSAIKEYLSQEVFFERVPKDKEYDCQLSKQFQQIFAACIETNGEVTVPLLIWNMYKTSKGGLKEMLDFCFEDKNFMFKLHKEYGYAAKFPEFERNCNDESRFSQDDFDDEPIRNNEDESQLETYVTNLNKIATKKNPLIGRQAELQRTIEILCRKDKNNVLHIGESGVGKTALVYGLAQMLEKNSDDLPECLNKSNIYMLDMGSLLSGSGYRGEFEQKVKSIFDILSKKKNTIVYIDDIHQIIGANSGDNNNIDGASLIKPYLESSKVKIIGSTTYEDYNKSFIKNKGFSRRFENIDILEPSKEECVDILKGIKKNYEKFHKVKYDKGVLEFIVENADRYITNRFLPDKAIDILDQTGAYIRAHQNEFENKVVDNQLVCKILSKICKVEILANNSKEDVLESLEKRINSQVFGQEKAVEQISQAILMANAGLNDSNKPMASFLFVGPTGVGKTEIAKVLAKQLNLELIRFDMSEYAEKHTVSKLIGSPAGYIGYEDGGLLTSAIKKTPHCVLLFDEIEKAHSDIYNILLQVMDYGTLTDNRGQKTNFRHTIIILTTNQGAQNAQQAGLGFNQNGAKGDFMLKSVKQNFKPEFLNRLSGITIFNDMTQEMAEMIFDKKFLELTQKLENKKIKLEISKEAKEYLMQKSFSKEYGGREIERTINGYLKPILTKEILFGKLKNPANAIVELIDNQIVINIKKSQKNNDI